MNLTLLGTKMLVEPIYDEEIGTVVIPDIAKNKVATTTGIIHAFGKAIHDAHPDIKCGMRAVFKPFSAASHQEIELNGKKHLIVDVAYLLGVIA